MTPPLPQAASRIPLRRTIVLFKLSCQNMRREPRKTEALASRQLLKPLHRGRRLRMLEFRPTKHFLDTWGFCLDGPEKWSFPINTISPAPGCPGGLLIPSPSSLCSLGKNSGDCFHGAFCSNPPGSCWRGAAGRANAVSVPALSKQGDRGDKDSHNTLTWQRANPKLPRQDLCSKEL